MENEVVRFICELYKEEGNSVNSALVRDIARQISTGHPKWPDEQVEGCVSLVLRSEFDYYVFGEEDAEEVDIGLIPRNSFVHGHEVDGNYFK